MRRMAMALGAIGLASFLAFLILGRDEPAGSVDTTVDRMPAPLESEPPDTGTRDAGDAFLGPADSVDLGVDGLLHRLESAVAAEHAHEARSAIDALRRLSAEEAAPAIPLLRTLLAKRSVALRAAITLACLGHGDAAVHAALLAGLGHEDDRTRVLVLRALGWAAHEPGVTAAAVVRLLADPRAEVRREAASLLSRLGAGAAGVIPEILATPARDTAALVTALEGIGPPAIPAILAALRSDDPRRARLAVDFLWRGEGVAVPEAIPELERILRERPDESFAALALGRRGVAACPALRRALASDDVTLRRTVSMSLCEWKPEIAAALLPDLVARFDDSDPQVRWNVLGSLTGGERGTALDVAVAVPALVACLRHEDEETRGIALGALQDLGEAAAPAARAVAAFLDSDDETERWSALQTLGAIGPAARPFLGAITDRLSDEDEFVREHAAFTIGLLGRESGPHIAALEAALEDPMIRDAAARVLWELTGETTRTLPVLLDGARAGRIPALYGLFRMAPEVPEAVPAITPGLEHRSWRVRHATIRALCRCGSTAASAVEPLRSAMLDDRLGNRLAAVEALGRIGPAARPAIPDIRRLLGWGRSWRDDETIRVTEEALRAIER